jgi:hypothetical protein
MNGWMDQRVEGWKDGKVDEWMDEWIVGWMTMNQTKNVSMHVTFLQNLNPNMKS